MKTLILVFLLTLPTLSMAAKTTTVYLVRHTEKDLTIKSDPPLTSVGEYRAKKWAEVFSKLEIDAVYSTDTIRTRDTAAPTVESQNLELKLYSPSEVNYKKFLAEHKGETVLVVGHSNTTPFFANGLLGNDQYQELDESEYSSLYQVTINGRKKHSQLLIINPLAD